MPFIPKNKKRWNKKFKLWSSEAKLYLGKKGRFVVLAVLCLLVFVLYSFGSYFPKNTKSPYKLPTNHGVYKNEQNSATPLIFPNVEHHQILQELGVERLFTLRIDVDGNKEYVLKENVVPMTEAERAELSQTDLKKFVKKSFYDHGKLVYKQRHNHPEVVIVSLIDFDKYSLDHLVKSVQNKVDYAQRHNYGVYVRWAQEFFPQVQKLTMEESYEFMKPLALRAAINAFPYAKYFWFIDQNSLIMKLDASLPQSILDPKILDIATLRNVPICEGSNIRTYKHFDVENAKIIVPLSGSGKPDTSSFIVTPSLYGKAFLDYLNDPLVRNFSWKDKTSGAIAHMLQWHPKMLQRTAFVAPKTIASVYSPSKSNRKDSPDEADKLNYEEGDFVISFAGCEAAGSCEADLSNYYEKVKKN